MKVESAASTGVYGVAGTAGTEKAEGKKAEQKKEDVQVFFAGHLSMPKDKIAEKKKEAQELALGIITDAYAREKEITDDLSDRRGRVDSLKRERSEARAELGNIEAEKEALKETYGVTEDSQEYKDLELLEKRQKDENLTEEERARLQQIDAEGMTEYQEKALEYNNFAAPFRKTIEEAKEQMDAETKNIREIKKGLVKSHVMVDADKQADEVLKQASKEIVGMLIQDSKDHIEEEQKEEIEEIEKKVEEKKEQEAKLEASKEETESLTGSIVSGEKNRMQMKEELQGILDKMKLTEEDLKGIIVNAEL